MSIGATMLLYHMLAVGNGDSYRARCNGGATRQEPVAVRIQAIDAPEYTQPHGRRARQLLSRLIERKEVQLQCVDIDAYGRRVCKVLVPPAVRSGNAAPADAGLTMIDAGMAWWYRHYADTQSSVDQSRYALAERDAQRRRNGLWRDRKEPTPPWRWRQAHRGERASFDRH